MGNCLKLKSMGNCLEIGNIQIPETGRGRNCKEWNFGNIARYEQNGKIKANQGRANGAESNTGEMNKKFKENSVDRQQ